MQSYIIPSEHQDKWELEALERLGSKVSTDIVTNDFHGAMQISKESIYSDSCPWDLNNLFQYKNNFIVRMEEEEEEEGEESNLRKVFPIIFQNVIPA